MFYIFWGGGGDGGWGGWVGMGCHFMRYIFCFGGGGGENDTLLIILFFLRGRVSLQVLV